MITKIFDRNQILGWEKQMSNSSCDWGISWSLQQKTLVEGKLVRKLIPTISKDMDEQLKLAHKMVDVID